MTRPVEFWDEPGRVGPLSRRQAARRLMDSGMGAEEALDCLLANFSDWDESKHARGAGGKFGPGLAGILSRLKGMLGLGSPAPEEPAPEPEPPVPPEPPAPVIPAATPEHRVYHQPDDDATRESIRYAQLPEELRSHAEAWAAGLPPEQHEALQRYTYMGYSYVNPKLLALPPGGNLADDPDLARTCDLLDRGIRSFGSLEKPVTVYRGMGTGSMRTNADTFFAASQAALASGEAISMPNYGSCSFDPRVANCARHEHLLVLEIRTRHGALVEPLSKMKGENEWIMPRGSRYRVTGVKVVQMDGKWLPPGTNYIDRNSYAPYTGPRRIVQLEEIPPDDASSS